MKIISFAVPCFNSADYMEKCVYSLLPLGDDIETVSYTHLTLPTKLEV